MLKETLTVLRNLFKGPGVQIFSDNAILYDSNSEFTTLAWDDNGEILYAFRPNNSHYNQDKKRMVVTATEYDNIQYVTTAVTRQEMANILNDMRASNTITDDIISEVLSSYDKLNNKIL